MAGFLQGRRTCQIQNSTGWVIDQIILPSYPSARLPSLSSAFQRSFTKGQADKRTKVQSFTLFSICFAQSFQRHPFTNEVNRFIAHFSNPIWYISFQYSLKALTYRQVWSLVPIHLLRATARMPCRGQKWMSHLNVQNHSAKVENAEYQFKLTSSNRD